jgi:hypothetical protein
VVALRKAGEGLVLTNLDASKYPEIVFSADPQQVSFFGQATCISLLSASMFTCTLAPQTLPSICCQSHLTSMPRACLQEVDVGKHTWGNYFVSAYKGVFEHLAAKGGPVPIPTGLQVLVHGTVPTGAPTHGWRLRD